MNRRELLLGTGTGLTIALAGCAADEDNEQAPETDDEPDDTSETDDDIEDASDDDADTDVEGDDTELKIFEVQAPETVEQGDTLETKVSLAAPDEVTVTATISDQEDTETIDAGDDLSKTIAFETDNLDGEYDLKIEAEADGESQKESVSINVVYTLEKWEEHTQASKEKIEEFLTNFTAVGSEAGDATILDTKASDGLRSADVTSPLFDADEELRDARSETDRETDGRELVDELQSEVDVLRQLATVQQEVGELFEDLKDDLEPTRPMGSFSSDSYDEAVEEFEELEEQLDETEPVVGEQYEDKVQQLEFDLEVFDEMKADLPTLASAKEEFDDGHYGLAADQAGIVRSTFSDVAGDVDDESSSPPAEAIDEDLLEVIEQWESIADDLQREASDLEAQEDD